jgi:hypothetical protein
MHSLSGQEPNEHSEGQLLVFADKGVPYIHRRLLSPYSRLRPFQLVAAVPCQAGHGLLGSQVVAYQQIAGTSP